MKAVGTDMKKEKFIMMQLYEFYILSLVRITKADSEIDLKEKVQAKAFIKNNVSADCWEKYYKRYLELLSADFDEDSYDAVISAIKNNGVLTFGIKRKFIYALAQIAQSKGELSKTDYAEIIYIAGKMDIDEVSAHNIIDSVFSITNTFIALIGIFCIGAALYFARALMMPLSLGYFLSRLIIKEQELLSRLIFKRESMIFTKIVSMFITFVLLFFMFLVGYQAIYEMGGQLPAYWEKLNILIEKVDDSLQNLLKSDDETEQEQSRAGESQEYEDRQDGDQMELEYQFLDSFGRFKEGLSQYDISLKNFLPKLESIPFGTIISSFVGSLFSFLAFLLMTFLFAGYLVFSDVKFEGIMLEMDNSITKYITTKFIISFFTGFCFYTIGILFNLDFAFLWGFLAFLLNFIPSIGSVISTIPPILISLITFPPGKAFLMALILIIVQNIMGNIIEPMFMGKTLSLNPVAVLAGLVFWGVLWGIPGMLMSAPLMALIKLVAENYSFSKNYARYL